MIISELIEKLEAAKKKYGDLKVIALYETQVGTIDFFVDEKSNQAIIDAEGGYNKLQYELDTAHDITNQ